MAGYIYQNQLSLYYGKDELEKVTKEFFKVIDLNDLIQNKDLGEIENNEGMTVALKMRELNPYCNIAFVEISDITEKDAKLKGFQIYKEAVTVTFTIKEASNLEGE